MSSLLLRLAGPAQSWGGAQLFPGTVHTERVPTRSGLLGLLACCLGAPRGQWPHWLEDTRIWVRVDRPGDIRSDYQTVNGVPEELAVHFLRSAVAEDPKVRISMLSIKTSTGGAHNISRRRYLADGEFIVAVEHDDHLDDLVQAVTRPRFMPFLGRKPFVPGFPFVLGVTDTDAITAVGMVPTTTDRVHLEVYPVVSDRNVEHVTVTAPVTSRKEQLSWASSHLSR